MSGLHRGRYGSRWHASTHDASGAAPERVDDMRKALVTALTAAVLMILAAGPAAANHGGAPAAAASCQGIFAGTHGFHGPTAGDITSIIARTHAGSEEGCSAAMP